MKKLLLVLLLLCNHTWAQHIVTFKTSRAVGVLTFLHAATGYRHSSATYTNYIWHEVRGKDSVRLSAITEQFNALELGFNYTLPGYPDSRRNHRSTDDLLMIAAVQSNGIADFMQRIMGILPNETWLKLKAVMQDADPLYDKLVASGSLQAITEQLHALEQYSARLDDVFNRLTYFYNSTWNSDIPFTVAVYPIPGNKGNTNATPHSNSLVMAVLTGEQDHEGRVAVAVHEMCHVMYAEQPVVFQQRMERWFTGSKDPNSAYAYNYIDEALATACGNAWVYDVLTGKQDTGEWYNDRYINTFAHAIYPIVKEYMGKARQVDSIFASRAIAAFSSQFPDAYRDYMNLMNKVDIYTNAKDHAEWGELSRVLNREFRISSSRATWPIADAMGQLDEATGTQLFVVQRDNAATFKTLSAKFPEMKNMQASKEGVISFFDKKKRPIIIVNVKDGSRLRQGFAAMNKAKQILADKLFTAIE